MWRTPETVRTRQMTEQELPTKFAPSPCTIRPPQRPGHTATGGAGTPRAVACAGETGPSEMGKSCSRWVCEECDELPGYPSIVESLCGNHRGSGIRAETAAVVSSAASSLTVHVAETGQEPGVRSDPKGAQQQLRSGQGTGPSESSNVTVAPLSTRSTALGREQSEFPAGTKGSGVGVSAPRAEVECELEMLQDNSESDSLQDNSESDSGADSETSEPSEPSESSDSTSEPNSGSGSSNEEHLPAEPATDLKARLREAMLRAKLRAGRESTALRIAVEIAWQGVHRSLRRARRREVETEKRFKLRLRTVGPVATLEEIFGREEMAKALETPDNPTTPPPPEAEAEGELGGPPPPLPKATAAWAEIRAKRQESPFVAGRVGSVELRWRPGKRPARLSGNEVWAWGPTLELGDEASRTEILRLLAKDLRSGAVEECSAGEVDVITPIFVARHPTTGKLRLIHDLRAVNALLCESTTNLPRAVEALGAGGYAAKLDLLQAFRHLSVPEADRRVLGFRIGKALLRWRALPFGLSQSPEFFCDALAKTMRKITPRVAGRTISYVDDVMMITQSEEILDDSMSTTMFMLEEDGWSIALEKTYPYAAVVCPFLGLLADLRVQAMRVSKEKAERLRDMCARLLPRSIVSLRELQKIGGLLAFFTMAVPDVALARRGIDLAAAECERLPGRTVGVKGCLRDDLAYWASEATLLPGRIPVRVGDEKMAMATDAAGVPDLGYGGLVWKGEAPDIEASLGDRKTFASRLADAEIFAGPIPLSLSGDSSSALEVYAAIKVIRRANAKDPGIFKGKTILWFCDSAVAVSSARRWRAKAAGLITQLKTLRALLSDLGCVIVPHWVSRNLCWQPAADFLTRVGYRRKTAEWSVNTLDYIAITTAAGLKPSIDLFAAEGNSHCESFASRYPVKGGVTDAFSMRWNGMDAWAFPPFALVKACIRHIECAKGLRILLVAPESTVFLSTKPSKHWALQHPLVNVEGEEALSEAPVPLRVYLINK